MEKRRKRKKGTRLTCMALLTAVLLSGCGGKGDVQTGGANVASKEHIYKVENLKLDGMEQDNINNLFYFEDKLAAMGYIWEEQAIDAVPEENEENIDEQPAESEEAPIEPRTEGAAENETTDEIAEEGEEGTVEVVEAVDVSNDIAVEVAGVDMAVEETMSTQKQFLAVYDYDGNQLSYVEWEMQNNEWMGQCTAGVGEEAIYCVLESYFEDYSDPDNYIWEENRTLVKMKLDGTEEWRISLDEIAGEEAVYVNEIACDKEGQVIVFFGNGKVAVIGADSVVKKQLDVGEESSGTAMISDNGKVMLTVWGEQGQYIRELNMETGQLSENYKVPGNSYNYSYYPGYGYDLFLTDSVALYGYNLGDEALTEIMNFVDSDLDASGIYNIYGKDDTQFYASYYSYGEDRTCYGLFTKVAPEDVKEKKLIKLGCCYLDYDVRREVVAFNKSNEEYRIQIIDYSTYNTEDDYTQGYTKLNTDIVSGNIPDIIMLNASLPTDSYISKGLFEDLYPYIDADEEMDRSDFITNVFDAFSTDGKLYQLVPAYTIFSVAAKTSDVGNRPGWTLDDLNAVMATKPEGTQVFFDTIRDSVLHHSIQMSSEQFINWETGECNFDSDGFIKLLEFVNQFPEEFDYSIYEDDSFWEGYESVYRDDKALLSITYLAQFADYNRMEKGTFGEEITMIGFPAANEKGSALDYNLSLAMSSKSKNKDGAWQFLRYFLSYEYQKDTYGFPTNRQRYEELKQQAMEKPFYLDENGQKVEYDETYYINGVEIVIPPMTAEEVQKVEDFIFSIDQTTVYNEDLTNIITEEAAAYFSGQKSAQEVASIIQSRVSIYVNENR